MFISYMKMSQIAIYLTQEQMQWKIFTVYSNNYYNCTNNYYHTIISIIYYVIIMIYCNVCKRSHGHKKGYNVKFG